MIALLPVLMDLVKAETHTIVAGLGTGVFYGFVEDVDGDNENGAGLVFSASLGAKDPNLGGGFPLCPV